MVRSFMEEIPQQLIGLESPVRVNPIQMALEVKLKTQCSEDLGRYPKWLLEHQVDDVTAPTKLFHG